MRFKHLLPVTLLAAFAVALPAAAQDGATRVATANPSKILAEMQETKDLNKKEADERQKLTEEERGRVAEVQKMREDRDKFVTRGTPEWEEKSQSVLAKTVELQTWAALKKAQLERKHKEELRALFNKITTASKDVASQKKIDLVVADYGGEIPLDLDPLTPDQLHGLIRNQNILFAGKGVDISSEIITSLDAKYKTGK